jgi:GDP-L-fucose synthase
LAEACFYLMQNYNEEGLVNVGTGEDITIKDLSLPAYQKIDWL